MRLSYSKYTMRPKNNSVFATSYSTGLNIKRNIYEYGLIYHKNSNTYDYISSKTKLNKNENQK